MKKEILKYHERVSTLEQENESLRRITDRANQENDQLLEKFDSVSKAARILQGILVHFSAVYKVSLVRYRFCWNSNE